MKRIMILVFGIIFMSTLVFAEEPKVNTNPAVQENAGIQAQSKKKAAFSHKKADKKVHKKVEKK